MIGDALRRHGCEVDVVPASHGVSLDGYDAVIVGGALYAGRWHRDAVRLVKGHRPQLHDTPVWLFSSGPLDSSADSGEIPPVRQVRRLMDRIAADGHQTFGGRLEFDAPGFMAHAMARMLAGDWRDPGHVKRWTSRIVDQLRNPVQAQAS